VTSRLDQVRQAGRFTRALYADRAGIIWHGARGDQFAKLRGRPGRLDPYPVYDRIRAEGGWVRTRLGNLATVDHAACSAILRSRRFGVQPEDDPHGDDAEGLSFLSMNPPDHTRLRRLAVGAFSPRRVASYRDSLDKTIDRLIDDALAKGRGGEPFDLVSAFAAPLPITVITELLGISRRGHGGVRALRHRDRQRPGRHPLPASRC
jgi:cytochrome P450